jgi:nitrate reductase alpha subunit
MPTPTNLINPAKWTHHAVHNANPKVDRIVDQQVERPGSEYSNIVLPANSRLEAQNLDCGGSCSNPFIQLWGGDSIPPLYDSKDDDAIFSLVADVLTERTGEARFSDYFRFVKEKKRRVHIQRAFDNCSTTHGEEGPCNAERMAEGAYGEPGAALMLFRTFPRVAFWEHPANSSPCGERKKHEKS